MNTEVAAKPRNKSLARLWLPLVGVLLIGAYAAMLIPAFDGQRQIPQAGMASVLWSSLFFYLLWRYRQQPAWRGGVLGAVIGLLVFMSAAFIGGMNHAA